MCGGVIRSWLGVAQETCRAIRREFVASANLPVAGDCRWTRLQVPVSGSRHSARIGPASRSNRVNSETDDAHEISTVEKTEAKSMIAAKYDHCSAGTRSVASCSARNSPPLSSTSTASTATTAPRVCGLEMLRQRLPEAFFNNCCRLLLQRGDLP